MWRTITLKLSDLSDIPLCIQIQTRRMSSRHINSFTIIELLAVVAIMAILTAILLPALQRAKDTARQIACANNLKQIAVVGLMYAGDADGWGFPRIAWGTVNQLDNAKSWVDDYLPASVTEDGTYVIKPVFRCPGMAPHNGSTYRPGYLRGTTLLTSYFFHFGTGTRVFTDNNSYYGNIMYDKSTQALPKINAPRLQLLGRTDPAPWLWGPYCPVYVPNASEQPMAEDAYDSVDGYWVGADNGYSAPNNHFSLRGHNVLYLDGHVLWQGGDARRRHQDYYNTFYY